MLDNLKYKIIDNEDGIFVGQFVAFPEVISQGESVAELENNLLDALKETLSLAIEEMTPAKNKKPFHPVLELAK